MVSSKLLDRFNIEHYSLFKALKAAAASTLPSIFGATSDGSAPGEASSPVSLEETASGSWHERQEAERMTEGWLKEFPSGFIVVSGPAGSGKTALVKKVVETDKKSEREALTPGTASRCRADPRSVSTRFFNPGDCL